MRRTLRAVKDDFEDVAGLEDGSLDPEEAPPFTEPWDEGADDETDEDEAWEDEEEDD
jgi:hypothetical protein